MSARIEGIGAKGMKREWGQSKTLELQLLGQGGEGVTRIREAGWSGELYAVRLDGVKRLQEAGAFERPGTYVAVHGTTVHSVGSSEALLEPYAEGERNYSVDPRL